MLFGQIDAVAGDAWEADFKMVTVGSDGKDLDSRRRFVRLYNDGAGGEVEWDAKDIGVFDAKNAFLVQFIGVAAERAADDLFAKELGAEGAHGRECE